MLDALKPPGAFTMATSLDLSDKIELRSLGELIERVNEICGGRPFLLAGATARDLLLEHAYRIRAPRATVDVDLAFLIDTWDDFHALRAELLHSGHFQ